jgi:predicted ArsR family transcriptional regulator
VSRARILDLLGQRQMTVRELADAMDIGLEGVRQTCVRLEQLGQIHVADYEVHHARRPAYRWALGPGERKPPPALIPARRHVDPEMGQRHAPTRREDQVVEQLRAKERPTWWGDRG